MTKEIKRNKRKMRSKSGRVVNYESCKGKMKEQRKWMQKKKAMGAYSCLWRKETKRTKKWKKRNEKDKKYSVYMCTHLPLDILYVSIKQCICLLTCSLITGT